MIPKMRISGCYSGASGEVPAAAVEGSAGGGPGEGEAGV